MAVEYGVGQDAQSQAFFRNAQAGDESTPIPGQVDSESIVYLVDAGTDIPARVDSPGIPKG